MAGYKIVSVDMFQTLVNVQTRIPFIWSRILGDAYTPEAGKHYASMLFGLAIPRFSSFADTGEFRTTKQIFEECFDELFAVAELSLDSRTAARIFAEEHGHAAAYSDTEGFLRTASAAYRVCLTTDADTDMITPHLERFAFDRVFVSEELRSYKSQPNGGVFTAIIDHYGVEPREIIHIGDSYADVFGANRCGIATCWLNRAKSPWQHELRPDFTVSSLDDVPALLAGAGQRAAD